MPLLDKIAEERKRILTIANILLITVLALVMLMLLFWHGTVSVKMTDAALTKDGEKNFKKRLDLAAKKIDDYFKEEKK